MSKTITVPFDHCNQMLCRAIVSNDTVIDITMKLDTGYDSEWLSTYSGLYPDAKILDGIVIIPTK